MLRKIILLPAVFLAILGHAQTNETRDCAATRITQRYLAEQGLPTDVLHALPQVSNVQRGGIYTVPVVVHVLWNTAAENVPDAAIVAIINEMNADYSQSNSDLSGVRATFTGVIGNVGFQFCLAQIDPNGNATTGITRNQTTETWFDPDTETNDMKAPPTGVSPWDPDHYLNIWVCDITSGATGGTITVGYAYLPTGGIVGSNIDGLVIDYDYGLDVGGRTATHEIGHYFGLMHTFDDNGACVNADGFADTPTTNSPTFSCANTGLIKCGVLTQYENFMDYSSCTAMFTDQQAAYMAGVLTGVRSSLLDADLCGGPTGPCVPTAAVGTSEGDYINAVQLGAINNTNSGGTSEPAYTDFSGTWSTSLVQGSTYSITIQSGNYTPDHYAAWIDYDQDDTFEAGEKLGEFTNTAVGESQSISFTVPAGATLGGTALRVRGVFHNDGEPTPSDPCYDYAWGETEDYGITITSGSGGACIPTSANGTGDDDYINAVQLGSINNTNSGGNGAPTYTDFSGTWSTDLTLGAGYSITIQSGGYTPDHYAAWIDYDQDNTFEAGEKLGEFTNTVIGQSQSISFTVPASALLGPTTLRVRGVYHDTGEPTPTDPCFSYAYGETEDYMVNIEVNTAIANVASTGIRIFPNPAASSVTLELPTDEVASIVLLDLQGRVVREIGSATSRVRMPLTGIAAGQYVVRIQQADQVTTHRLQVVEDLR
ncbi:MAG: GEVED domain-containing protein [Flavobacteriales bacterium]